MRRATVAAAAVAAASLVVPAPAAAHGLARRADLPIPEWLFGWAAAVVLVVSFVALAVLWNEPRLENRAEPSERRASPAIDLICGAIGVALLGVVVWSGFAGVQSPDANLAPTFVYVEFWVGLVVVSLLFGDVFRLFNPWRALGRAFRLRPRAPYPSWLGRWPAAIGILGFTAMELVLIDGEQPRTVAIATLVYSGATLAAMARFGAEEWSERGEAFGVYFNLISRISPLERLRPRRRPLEALTRIGELPGTVPLLAVMIGTVTFDGLSSGSLWTDTVQPEVFDALSGLGEDRAEELTNFVGLLAAVGIVGLFYRLGVAGAASVGGGFTQERLRAAFVHSLVPIAVVYVLAHYLTLLVFDGQAIGYLVSDPLGKGWDLFGTASAGIDFSILGQNATWYLQVGFVVAGHVAALTLAHDRALVLYDDHRLAVRSQYWMLAVMVGFTSLALWLLAQQGG